MKTKSLIILVCTALCSLILISCGGRKTANDNSNESSDTEYVAEEKSPLAKEAVAELEKIYQWLQDLNKKDQNGKLSEDEKMGAFMEFLSKIDEWDKKYDKLKEADYTPKQWARVQEIKNAIVNISVK